MDPPLGHKYSNAFLSVSAKKLEFFWLIFMYLWKCIHNGSYVFHNVQYQLILFFQLSPTEKVFKGHGAKII